MVGQLLDYIGRNFTPFSNFDVTIKIDKEYVIGMQVVFWENPTEKGYTENNDKTDKTTKAILWRFTAKHILDFVWAAEPNYSVETLIMFQTIK